MMIHIRPGSALRAGLLVSAAFSLAACTDRLATQSTISDDYRQRHPIVLDEAPVTLNLFPAARLDEGSRRRIIEFAAQARSSGAGGFEIMIPAGARNEAQARAAAPAIRAALAAAGGMSTGIYLVPHRSQRQKIVKPINLIESLAFT